MTHSLDRLLLSAARALALLVLPGAVNAQAATALWFQEGSSTPVLYQSPSAAVTVRTAVDRLEAAFTGTFNTTVTLAAPAGQALSVGYYDHAVNDFSYPPTPAPLLAMQYSCNYAYARFTVLESVFDGVQVVRFAANFEYRCSADNKTTYGEVRINSSVPLSVQRAAGWTQADPIAYPTRQFVTPGSDAVSDPERVYGITSPAPISVTNGQYSVNGGPFTSASGAVSNRDMVRVLVTAPAGLNDSASALVNIGGMVGSFTASTPTTGNAITALRLEGTAGDPMLGGTSITVASPEWRLVNSNSNQFAFSSQSGPSYSMFVNGPTLLVGSYEGGPLSTTNPTVGASLFDGFGSTRSCAASDRDRFVVLDVAGGAGTYTRLAIDFELYCGGTPVFGEFRLGSTWPFTFEKPAGSTSPDAFAFRPSAPQVAGATSESLPTTIYGINTPTTIQVAGGEYSVNGGAYTASTGTVSNKDHVRVRGVAPAMAGATSTVTLTVGGKTAGYVIQTFGPGMRYSSLHLEGGYSYDGISPEVSVRQDGNGSFSIGSGAFQSIGLSFYPNGQAFVPGTYESLQFNSTTANIVFYAPTCNRTGARLVVREASYVQGTLDAFAADFQIFCSNSPTIYGEFRYRSSVPSMHFLAPGSTVPDAMTFTPVTNAQGGKVFTSNRVVVYGINVPVPLTILDGEYSLNGGAYTSAPGTAHNGDDIVVRVVSTLAPGVTRTATVNVGGRMASFAVTTYQPGTVISSLVFTSTASDIVAHGASGRAVAPSPDTITVYTYVYPAPSSMTIVATTAGGETYQLYIAAAQGQLLQVGDYPNAVVANSLVGSPAVSFDYRGTGCFSPGPASFTVLDVASNGSTVQSFAANFEMHCGNAGTLRGQVRINSAVPSDAFPPPPVVARRGFDANGDGRNDILFAHADGRAALWLMDGPSQVGGGTLLAAGTGWSIAGQGDFNGDGKSDVLWKHTDGRVAMWLMNGSTQIGGGILLPAGTGWLPKLVGDFNGDGKADILWEHSDGSSALWIMDGFAQVGGGRLFSGGTGWYAKLLGDLNGDGKADIIWTNTDGRAAVWIMNGSQQVGGGVLITAGTGWTPKLAIDVNGDGKADLVWLNADGKSAVWLMNGVAQAGGGILMNSGSTYVPVLGGDIDGDGKADIVWRAADGTTIFWLMNGAAQAGGGQILAANSGWTVARVADFSGDLIGDLLLVNDDGRVQMRIFDGLGFTSTATLLDAGSGWAPVTTP